MSAQSLSTQGNYKAIDLSSSGLFLSIESQDAMHTLGSHHVIK